MVEWKVVDTVGSLLRILDCLELNKISRKGDSSSRTCVQTNSKIKLDSLF